MMEYKGYVGGQIEVEDGMLHGRVLGLRDVISFEGRTARELQKAFHDSIDDYLEWCAERGELPDKAYSGTFNLRVDPALHRKIALASDLSGVSQNAWIARTLEVEADKAVPSPAPRKSRGA